MTGNLFEGSAPSDIVRATGSQPTATAARAAIPGPSGYGAVVEDAQGQVVARLSRFLGIQTNNYAEYSGLLAVLEWALENGAKRLRVVSDSELMVKQMKGQYKVKSPGLRAAVAGGPAAGGAAGWVRDAAYAAGREQGSRPAGE